MLAQHARHEVVGRARKDAVDAQTQRGSARGTECVTRMTRQCRKPDPRGVLLKTSACECNKLRSPFILPLSHADAYVLNYDSTLFPVLFVLLVPLSLLGLLGLLTDNQPARHGKRASQELKANQPPAKLPFLLPSRHPLAPPHPLLPTSAFTGANRGRRQLPQQRQPRQAGTPSPQRPQQAARRP